MRTGAHVLVIHSLPHPVAVPEILLNPNGYSQATFWLRFVSAGSITQSKKTAAERSLDTSTLRLLASRHTAVPKINMGRRQHFGTIKQHSNVHVAVGCQCPQHHIIQPYKNG